MHPLQSREREWFNTDGESLEWPIQCTAVSRTEESHPYSKPLGRCRNWIFIRHAVRTRRRNLMQLSRRTTRRLDQGEMISQTPMHPYPALESAHGYRGSVI